MNQHPRLNHRLRCGLSLVAVALLGGCAVSSNVQQIDNLEAVGDEPRIVMMPPDIRYYRLTTGGVPEPNAEWTDAAQANFTVAMESFAKSIGADLAFIDKSNLNQDEIRYESLHSAVGTTLLQNYFGTLKLPSKGDGFDWTLGPEINVIGENHNADYALFVYYRDYQASGGRIAFSILAAAAGVAVPTGSEHGFASLVDLRTGDIVWFNVVTAGSGEFRSPDGADSAVKRLFKDIPTQQADDAT